MSCKCEYRRPTIEDIKKASNVNWNITIGKNHEPLQLYDIKDCIHTKGYPYSSNTYYAADRDIPKSELKPDDLMEFNGEVCWGYEVKQEMYNGRHGTSVVTNAKIFCAGEQVYEIRYGWNGMAHKIMTVIDDLKSHPIDFDFHDYEKDLIGRKVWWNDQPGVITGYIKKQGSVFITPAEGEYFKLLNQDKNETCEMFTEYASEREIKVDILAKSIRWFRDI